MIAETGQSKCEKQHVAEETQIRRRYKAPVQGEPVKLGYLETKQWLWKSPESGYSRAI